MIFTKHESEKNSPSKGSFLDKYQLTSPPTKSAEPKATDEEVVYDDLGAYGVLRGTRDKALMLALIQRDGSMTSLGNAWLQRATFEPSVGITLYFGHTIVRITGSSLNQEIRPNVRLFDFLMRHRISWIKEADESAKLDSRSNAVVIESIIIEA